MGNTPSVEVPGKGSRATQKLSKPRIGNPATAGLLNPNGVSDIIHRPSSIARRRLSLPYSSTSVHSPRHPETVITVVDDQIVSHESSPTVEDFSTHSLLQSDSQGAPCQGDQSGRLVVGSSRDRRMSRTNSSYMGADEGYEQAQLDHVVLPRNTSRSSVNYDLSSYEAKRLLNLVEAPPLEDRSVASEGQFQGALSRRQSYTPSYYPAHSDLTAPLPRTNSGTSLYTPMQSMGAGFLSISRSPFDPSLLPRAHTPCDTDYKQTGAFKHGTLRITNGSPARTPAWESSDDGLRSSSPSIVIGQGSYFDAGGRDPDSSQSPAPPHLTTPSATSASNLNTLTGEREAVINLLPELKLTVSPFSIGEIKPGSPELQTTSKNTVMEDGLFEDGTPEYGTEILNVRLDHDAFTPSASSEEEKGKGINRSDSGVVASPVSDVPHKTLSKADSGYSSSVSIRSSSSKRNGRREINYSRNLETVSPQTSTFERAKLSGNFSMPTHPDTAGPLEMHPQPLSSNELPPPVPEKDDQIKVAKQVTIPSNDFRAPARKPGLVPTRVFPSEAPKLSDHSTLGPNGHSSVSTLSVSNARKQGRLQRFLSGARAPLAVHVTHDLDRDSGVPPVPREVREKLHERARLSPDPLENSLQGTYTWKDDGQSTAVNETLFNHDNTATTRDAQNHGSSARTDQERIRSLKSSFHIHSIGSTITRAASSVMAKNPISRKAMLSRMKPDDADINDLASGPPAITAQHASNASQWHQRSLEDMDSTSPPVTGERERYGRQAAPKGRSNSLSAPLGGLNTRIYDDARRSLMSQNEQHAITFQKPSLPGQYFSSRTPPPVSMKTRSIGPLRVPPPIRPRSTPPVKSGAPALSRKPSREGVQSYPPYNRPMNSNHATLSRRSSQESFYTYSTAQIQAFLNQPSQVSNAMPWGVQSHLGEYRGLGGVTNANYGMAFSGEPSFDHSRRNSLASQTSHRSVLSNGQPWSHYSSYDPPTLKHRSSHDGFSFQRRQGYGQANGPYPSSRINGQMYAYDYSNGQPMLAQSQQYQQHARYAPHGHLRHHSLDQNGSLMPYRVLHSYNSPAYRGVPIWSG
ncbi:hypothetical protein GQX73_g9328 [Xylaria multiplex]|uniref:Uncharacterized protein n=1 Tax=Xylaria multiplex TaxID=323545 RepID=A0A7C8MLI0_9PEZI|nr:hypothetical protein GQX73_g9328 [Xylaria multiplex]